MTFEKNFKELNQTKLENTIGGNNRSFLIVGPFDWFKKLQGKNQKHM